MEDPAQHTDAVRVAALERLDILDTAPEEAFDDIVRSAASICDTPMAAVSIVDADRQWFKASVGLEMGAVARADAFCDCTISQRDVFEVPDTAADPRWASTPYVAGPPYVRFYAGTPLVTTDGHPIGTVCVVDTVPRRLDDHQRVALKALAAQAMTQIELRQQIAAADRSRREADKARAALRSSERRFRTLIERSTDVIVLSNPAIGFRYMSPSASRVLGFAPEELADADLSTFVDDPASQVAAFETLTSPPGEWSEPVELRMRHRDGTLRWVEVRGSNRLDDPDVNAWVFNVRDVTQRRRAEEAARAVIDTANDAFVQTDASGIITAWTRQSERIFGWSDEDAIGRTVDDLIVPERLRDDRAWSALRSTITAATDGTIVERTEGVARRRDGSEVPIEMTVWATRAEGDELRFNAFLRDVTERHDFEAQLVRQALHDDLTWLPNRSLLLDRLESALARGRRNDTLVGVLFCDLDHFKVINDSRGHTAGDAVLRIVARRLEDSVRSGDTVARFGGDEFVIVADCVDDHLEASRLGERVLQAIEQPIVTGGSELWTSASIGVAVGAGDAVGEDLLRDADAAMYRAKERGRARIEVFDAELRARVRARLDDEQALRLALERDELRLLYQPVVSLRRGTVVGAEALVRWDRPGHGRLTPDRFIPLAEETGIIDALGRWVLHEACRQLQTWSDDGLGDRSLMVSVNVSARQLRAELADVVDNVLASTGTKPSHLALELTESSLMEDPAAATATLGALRRRGARIAVDDFGTGYSSLGYLKALPIDTLKIDRSFVTNLAVDRYDAAIVGAITTIADALRLAVVAEGVETPEQLEQVRAHGCRLAQGYHFARPLDAADFAAFVRDAPVW